MQDKTSTKDDLDRWTQQWLGEQGALPFEEFADIPDTHTLAIGPPRSSGTSRKTWDDLSTQERPPRTASPG